MILPNLVLATNQKMKNRMVTQDKIIEIYCSVDDFYTAFESENNKHQLGDGTRKRNMASTISDSEFITKLIMFHNSRILDFKHYYIGYVCKHLQKIFLKQYPIKGYHWAYYDPVNKLVL
jgi:hypothetical protein